MSNKFKFLSLILLLSISTLSYSNRRENNGIIDTTPGGGGFGGGRDTDKYWYCGDTYVPRIGGISKSEACSANFNLRLDSNVDNKPIKPIYGNVENKAKYKVSIIPEDDTIFVRKIISEEDSTIISPGEVDLKPTSDNTTGSVTVSVNNNRYEDRDVSTSIHEIPAPELGETQFLISAKRYEIHGSDLIGVEIDEDESSERKLVYKLNDKKLKSELEGKLNKDLSNLSDNSILESKLSEGVRDKLNSKLDKNLSNLTDHVIVKEKLSTEVIKEIEGKLNKDLSNINDKEKESLRKNLDVYNKGEVDSKLETKLNKDLSNLADNSILESKLSEGVRDKLNNKVDKDGNNINIEKFIEKLNENSNISIPTGSLVKDSDVKNYLENNYTNNIELKKQLDKKMEKDLSNLNDKEKETLRKNLDVYNKGEVDSKLEGKLNKDLSNLSDNTILESKLSEGVRDKLNNKVDKDGNNINIEKFIEKLNENSNISIPTGSLVKDSDVKNYLENNYTNNIELKKQLDKKLEKDLSNLNDNEKENLRKNLDLYSKKEINDSLAVKANKDGSNIEVDKYISILSNGSNVQNPKNMLVTDKMLKEYISKNQGIVYDNVDKTELSLYNTTIHNVSDGINPTDAVNKRQLDSVASGVAVAIANSNLSTQKGHSIGIGIGYFKKEWGISLGYSGEINRFGFKVNSGLSSKLEFSAGLGLSYSFGKKEEPFVMKADDNNLDIFVDRINNIEKNVKEKLEKYINEDRKGMERDIEKLKSENLNLKKEISKIYEILKDKKEVVSDVVVVDKFEFDKTDISKDNMKKIDEFLGKRKISILNIIGHTDKVGTEEYNIDLSLRRAKSVKEYIKNKMLYGVINIFGKGEKEPISSNDEENRRVELIVEEE